MQYGDGSGRKKRAECGCNKLNFYFAVFLFFFGESIQILTISLRIAIEKAESEE